MVWGLYMYILYHIIFYFIHNIVCVCVMGFWGGFVVGRWGEEECCGGPLECWDK